MMSPSLLFQPTSNLLRGVDRVGPDGAPIKALDFVRPRAPRRGAVRASVARGDAAGPFTVLLASGGTAQAGDCSGVISALVAGAR